MAKTRQKPDLLQGTLDLLILRALQWGPQHGHGIGVALRASSEEVLRIDHGSLYPALHRLEQRGLLAPEWRDSETGREAKYYRLTRKGRAALEQEHASWNRLASAVAGIIRAAAAESAS
jgi:PadR family transcriptional regulator, regulatory protein PadR